MIDKCVSNKKSYKVDNAIIMAAGLSSRFAPLSFEKPKALIKVKDEVLIERQIRQLKEVGIDEIIIVVGYKKEEFEYLREKYEVKIVENTEYAVRNNNSTIYAVKDYLGNSYICSSDNYFLQNPFESEVNEAYYAAVYSNGATKEWCMTTDDNDRITAVTIGGNNQWYMLGHAFWTSEFSKKFVSILEKEYRKKETADKLWESIYVEHIDELELRIRRYPENYIYEFDSLDELRLFDAEYFMNSGSKILVSLTEILSCQEKDIACCNPYKNEKGMVIGFTFLCKKNKYLYLYENGYLKELWGGNTNEDK